MRTGERDPNSGWTLFRVPTEEFKRALGLPDDVEVRVVNMGVNDVQIHTKDAA